MNESKGQYWIREDQAPLFIQWVAHQGGVAVWKSLDISNPDREWATPFQTLEGDPSPPPHELADPAPARVLTSLDQIIVAIDAEVERVLVTLEQRGQNTYLTKDSSAQVREAQKSAGDGAYYQFDDRTKEAVILAPHRTVSLAQWAQEHPN